MLLSNFFCSSGGICPLPIAANALIGPGNPRDKDIYDE